MLRCCYVSCNPSSSYLLNCHVIGFRKNSNNFFSAGLRLVEAEIEAFQLILLVFVWVNNAADIVG